jgi:hypothetical protein
MVEISAPVIYSTFLYFREVKMSISSAFSPQNSNFYFIYSKILSLKSES